MAEDKKEKKDKKQKNKGVNVNPAKTIRNNHYFSDTDSFTQSASAAKSISRVRNELQTVIDLMGPNTPQFLQSPSNDGDNELSATSETNKSWAQDKNKPEEPSEAFSEDTTDKTVPPDITLQEDTDISIVADKNSTTFEFQEYPKYMCPPPLIPANILYNSECICPQMASYIHNGTASMPYIAASQMEEKRLGKHKNLFYNFFKNLVANLTAKNEGYVTGKTEYYTMNIKESRNENSPPRRLVFDLVGDIPRRNWKLEDYNEPYDNTTLKITKAKDMKNFNNEQLTREAQQNETLPGSRESDQILDKNNRKFNQKIPYADGDGATRVDVYYFDRGDSNYLKTTDSPPVVATENLAEKTEAYTTRFWAEIFGTLHIGVSFGISFVLQFFRFFLYSLLRPLTIGLVQLGTDYFLKPCIATLFNAIVQPPLIFLYNVCVSFRDICHPMAEGMGYFLRETATAIRAFRIIEVRKEKISDRVSNTEKDKIEDKTEKTELVA